MAQTGPGERPVARRPGRRVAKRKPQKRVPYKALTPALKPGIPKLGSFPGHKKAHAIERKIARTAPARPTPHVPVIHHPTPRQTQAAKQVITSEINRRVGKGGTGAERLERRRAVMREIAVDPRQKPLARAIKHYARNDERQTAQRLGERLGYKSKARQIRAGRDLIAHQQQRDIVRPGRAPKVLTAGPANLPIGAIAKGLTRGVAATTSLDTGDVGPRQFVSNAAKDVAALGTAPFIGGYEITAGALEAATGKGTERLQKLAKGVAHGISESVPGQLAQGDVMGAAEAFRQHPVFGALDVAGAASVGGRVAGALSRTAGRSRTIRPPVALVDDASVARSGAIVERRYSKDASRRFVQEIHDARREPVRDAEGKPVTVRQGGVEVPVLKPRNKREQERLAGRRADIDASRANALERMARVEVDRAFHKIDRTGLNRGQVAKRGVSRGVRGARHEQTADALLSMIATGTIRSAKTFKTDLVKHAQRIRTELREHPDRYATETERNAAVKRAQLVEAAARNPRLLARADRLVQLGTAHGRLQRQGDAALVARGVLPKSIAERTPLQEYAIEHMRARFFSEKEIKQKGLEGRPGIRNADGTPLPNAAIEAHARAHGREPESLAFLPHRLEEQQSGSFHAQFRPGTRPNFAKGELRTGELYRRGSTAYGRELLRDQATRQATHLTKAEQLDRQIQDLGLRHPAWAKAEKGGQLSEQEQRIVKQGGYFTGREAKEYARRAADRGEDLIPIRAYQAKLSSETKAAIRGEFQDPQAIESIGERLFNTRLDVKKGGERNVVLLPAAYVTRLQRQLQPRGELNKFFQLLNAPFRMAVLPQPRWLTGNLMEPFVVRLTMSGAGVNIPGLALDIRAANKTLKGLERGTKEERAAAREIRAQQLGGLFVGRRDLSNRRTFEDFNGRTREVLRAAHVVRNAPVLKTMGDMILALPHMFFAVNRAIESTAQKAALGKAVREDVQAFTKSWAKTVTLGDKAISEAKRGLTGTATQERFIRAQHELLGQYGEWSPTARAIIQGPMPFVPWVINAMRFVYWTMPAHHTIAEDLLIKSSQVVQQQWDEAHADVPPGGLKLAQITGKGGLVDIARYTPYGFSGPLASGDLQGIGDVVLPQISGSKAALEGKDPFGRDLQVEPTPTNPKGIASGGQRALVAINSFFEATIPLLAQARRLREGGGTAYADSNILYPKTKPGSKHMSGLRRVFDPFRPTYLKTPVATGGGGGPKLGEADRREIRQAIAEQQYAPEDLDEIRRLIREQR